MTKSSKLLRRSKKSQNSKHHEISLKFEFLNRTQQDKWENTQISSSLTHSLSSQFSSKSIKTVLNQPLFVKMETCICAKLLFTASSNLHEDLGFKAQICNQGTEEPNRTTTKFN